MKRIKVSFDTWIQLLGMIGVLGGLVFVGLQMEQSQRIAIIRISNTKKRSYFLLQVLLSVLKTNRKIFEVVEEC